MRSRRLSGSSHWKNLNQTEVALLLAAFPVGLTDHSIDPPRRWPDDLVADGEDVLVASEAEDEDRQRLLRGTYDGSTKGAIGPIASNLVSIGMYAIRASVAGAPSHQKST